MKPIQVKTALFDTIQAMTDYKWFFSVRSGKDNTRNRKFPFQKMITSILAFKGGTLNHEIMDFFGLDPSIGTASAFIQQRAKILPEAFETLFQHFTSKFSEHKYFHGYRLLAVDGSDLQTAANPDDTDSFFPGTNDQKPYNLLHIISDSAHICLEFFRGKVLPPNVEALLMRFISPVRPGRSDTRKKTPKPAVSFTYRVA